MNNFLIVGNEPRVCQFPMAGGVCGRAHKHPTHHLCAQQHVMKPRLLPAKVPIPAPTPIHVPAVVHDPNPELDTIWTVGKKCAGLSFREILDKHKGYVKWVVQQVNDGDCQTQEFVKMAKLAAQLKE